MALLFTFTYYILTVLLLLHNMDAYRIKKASDNFQKGAKVPAELVGVLKGAKQILINGGRLESTEPTSDPHSQVLSSARSISVSIQKWWRHRDSGEMDQSEKMSSLALTHNGWRTWPIVLSPVLLRWREKNSTSGTSSHRGCRTPQHEATTRMIQKMHSSQQTRTEARFQRSRVG